jgi:hypothetical protein
MEIDSNWTKLSRLVEEFSQANGNVKIKVKVPWRYTLCTKTFFSEKECRLIAVFDEMANPFKEESTSLHAFDS